MYAIVEIAGQQFKVEQGQEIYVHRLDGNTGSSVDFSHVLLIDNEGAVNVGTPVIEGALVQVTILEHLKGDKVLVFKKKNRKGYKKLNGHRQYLSLVRIEEIVETGGKPRHEAAKKPRTKKVKEEAVESAVETKAAAAEETKAVVEKPKAQKKAPAKPKTAKTVKAKAKSPVKEAPKAKPKTQSKAKPKGKGGEKPAKG